MNSLSRLKIASLNSARINISTLKAATLKRRFENKFQRERIIQTRCGCSSVVVVAAVKDARFIISRCFHNFSVLVWLENYLILFWTHQWPPAELIYLTLSLAFPCDTLPCFRTTFFFCLLNSCVSKCKIHSKILWLNPVMSPLYLQWLQSLFFLIQAGSEHLVFP